MTSTLSNQARRAPAWPRDTLLRPVVMAFGASQDVRPGFIAKRLNTFIGALNLVAPRPR